MRGEELLDKTRLRRRPRFSPLDPVHERRVRLDRETVDREMVGRQRECTREVRLPVPLQFRRESEDEIQREILDSRLAKRRDRRRYLLPGVSAMHPTQDQGLERLHAEGDPVHTDGTPRGGSSYVHVVGVGLERDFPPGDDAVRPAHRLKQFPNELGLKKGRRTAAEVHRIEGGRVAPGRMLLPGAPFLQNSLDIQGGRHVPSYRDREIAVAAPPGAEGDVDVDVHAEGKNGRRKTEDGRREKRETREPQAPLSLS